MRKITLRILLWIWLLVKWTVIVGLVLAVSIAVAVQIPAVQQFAIDKGAAWFSEKTGGQLTIDRFDLRIPNYLAIEGLKLDDPKGHTVASLGQLEIKLGWRKLMQEKVLAESIYINDLYANIYSDTSSVWNYDFILDAFASEATETDTIDEGGSSWDVVLRKLRLSEIDLRYYDAVSRDSFKVAFGTLRVGMKEFSLKENRYRADRLYFADSKIRAQLGPRTDDSTPEEETADHQEKEEGAEGFPDLFAELILLERHDLSFIDLSDGSRYAATLNRLQLIPGALDLKASNYEVESLEADSLHLDMHLPASPPSDEPFDGDIFAPISLHAKIISITKSDINIHSFSDINNPSESDTSIELGGIHLEVRDLIAGENRYQLEVEKALFNYGDLPHLDRLSFAASVTPEAIELRNLDVGLGRSAVLADASLSYPSLAALVNDLQIGRGRVSLKKARLHPDDIAALLKMANPDSALPALPQAPIYAEMLVEGNAQKVNLRNLQVTTGKTRLKAAGSSQGDEWARHEVRLSTLDLQVHLEDLNPWLPDSLDRSILPSRIGFAGKAHAGPQQSALDGWLSLHPMGDVHVDVATGGWNSEQYDLTARLESAMVDLTSFAQSDTFYTCFSLDAQLTDLTGDTLRGDVLLDIPEFRMDAMQLSHIIIADTIVGDFHRFGLSVTDSSLVATLTGMADLTEGLDVVVDADIPGIDFEYLGLSRADIRLRTGFSAAYIQHDSLQMGSLKVKPSVVVREEERVDVEPIDADFFFGPDSTGIQIVSEQVTLRSTSNLPIDLLIGDLKDLLKEDLDDRNAQGKYWELDFRTGDLTLLHDLLLPDLGRLDPAEARVRYSGNDRSLRASLSLPYVEYGNITIDSTSLSLRSDQGLTTGSFGIRQVAYDTLTIDQIGLTMTPDSAAGTHFQFSLGGPLDTAPYRLGAHLRFIEDEMEDHWMLRPYRTIAMSGRDWQIDEEAAIRFADSGTEIHQLNFTRNQQALRFSKEGAAETLYFEADDFKLQTLAEVFSQEEALFSGLLDAALDLNSDGTFIGQGLIEDLHLAGAEFGQLRFGGESIEQGYHLSANMEGPALDLNADGTIEVREDGTQDLDLEVNLERFSAKTLESLAPSLVAHMQGEASGQIKVSGTSSDPAITGELRLHDIDMRIKGSGQYGLEDETIRIEPKAFIFPGFQVTDSAGYKLTVDGRIRHENFQNFRYDLTVKSDRFTLLDVKKGENELFYGRLIVGTDIRVTGTQELPVIRSDISLKRGSQLVFVVPESDYSTFEDDGLVEWVEFDQEALPSILGKEKEESGPGLVETFIDLAGNLNIDKETKFRIIIDPLAGDYLEIEGGGKLSLGYDRAGRINLSGTYTVTSGAYQMTFYNVVKRRFLLEPGSRITWNGDPFSADLNLTAIYPTRASALGLLNTTTSGAGSEGMRRMLDWEVLMEITGELEKPEIGFDLRMDRESQTSRGSMAGAIESRLAQLRQNESELNMQVFALMVFNTFISEGGGGMSGGDMMTNQARNSASQLLTQQLNNLSDKLVGGVELTFDLQSYGSEGATETDLSVDLSKTLFDDRVVVRVGSTVALEQNDPLADQSQQMMTNFIVEYKITTDGRYRLKAFRKTDVEDILVGRITRTGAGVVFRRSFDRGDQIFTKDESEKEIDEALEQERKKAKEEKKNQKNGNRGEE